VGKHFHLPREGKAHKNWLKHKETRSAQRSGLNTFEMCHLGLIITYKQDWLRWANQVVFRGGGAPSWAGCASPKSCPEGDKCTQPEAAQSVALKLLCMSSSSSLPLPSSTASDSDKMYHQLLSLWGRTDATDHSGTWSLLATEKACFIFSVFLGTHGP
jgi:hypothetical protein